MVYRYLVMGVYLSFYKKTNELEHKIGGLGGVSV